MIIGFCSNDAADKLSAAGAERISGVYDASLISPGDTVIFASLHDMCDLLKSKSGFRKLFNEEKIELYNLRLVVLDENFDTARPEDMNALRLYGRIDREWNMRANEKRREAISISANTGKTPGRKMKETDMDALRELFAQYRSGSITIDRIVEETGLGRTTIYRRLKDNY